MVFVLIGIVVFSLYVMYELVVYLCMFVLIVIGVFGVFVVMFYLV